VADFAVSDANRAAVTEIVRLLDGLPLAIELAAARMRVLSPAQLLQRMGDRFAILADARGATARQATLEAAIDWSWNLLSPWEQAALAQCSVFEGGFTLQAAEAVLDLSPWPGVRSLIDVVQSLVDKSLLRTWIPGEHGRYDLEEPYFGMYLSIRDYAARRLAAGKPGARRAAEERHGRYFAGFGSDEAIQALFLHGGDRRLRALELELDNLVAACRNAVARSDGPTAVGAYRAAGEVLELQGPSALSVELGGRVLSLGDLESTVRAAAILTQARAAWRSGRTEEAETGLEEALSLARASGDRACEAAVLRKWATVHREQGRLQAALTIGEAALAMHREVGDRGAEGSALAALGSAYDVQGRIEEAGQHFTQALAIHREVGNRRGEGSTLCDLGTLHGRQGHAEEARGYFELALAIHRELGDRRSEGDVLGNLGMVHIQGGRTVEAQAYFQQALAIAREVGSRRTETILLGNLGSVAFEQDRLDEARDQFERALAICRDAADSRHEADLLVSLAEVHVREGRNAEARAALQAGETLLREAGDPSKLAGLLCIRGQAELIDGDIGPARAALAEAESPRQVPRRRSRLASGTCHPQASDGAGLSAQRRFAGYPGAGASSGASSLPNASRQPSSSTPAAATSAACRPQNCLPGIVSRKPASQPTKVLPMKRCR
jgi:tetratricopeptide (TPR) repeat protein